MKIIIKLLSFLIILNFISCYDDKGNYDYEKINDITIEFPDFSWQQIIGETLKVYPKLKYAFNDSTDLKLKFESDGYPDVRHAFHPSRKYSLIPK